MIALYVLYGLLYLASMAAVTTGIYWFGGYAGERRMGSLIVLGPFTLAAAAVLLILVIMGMVVLGIFTRTHPRRPRLRRVV